MSFCVCVFQFKIKINLKLLLLVTSQFKIQISWKWGWKTKNKRTTDANCVKKNTVCTFSTHSHSYSHAHTHTQCWRMNVFNVCFGFGMKYHHCSVLSICENMKSRRKKFTYLHTISKMVKSTSWIRHWIEEEKSSFFNNNNSINLEFEWRTLNEKLFAILELASNCLNWQGNWNCAYNPKNAIFH